ncbi:hypothetical protein [Natribacillus halophilus]|uniref:Uncharacterized protein n=1 Tax=Natribacillus halophilus TaxID=549003 RepID=A0A1G8RUV1_9BACI|nr:hypothetical protein [Natribacillus halophilus]SDJ20748.1 hypothetical protein SAMN04488123_12060 [Natribacillus halophilus]
MIELEEFVACDYCSEPIPEGEGYQTRSIINAKVICGHPECLIDYAEESLEKMQ